MLSFRGAKVNENCTIFYDFRVIIFLYTLCIQIAKQSIYSLILSDKIYSINNIPKNKNHLSNFYVFFLNLFDTNRYNIITLFISIFFHYSEFFRL